MKKVMCPLCMTKGDFAEMKIIDELFLKCNKCNAEVWTETSVEGKLLEPEDMNNTYRSCSLPEGVKIHGGEKRNGKNPALAKMSKKPVSAINQGLYKSE